MFTEREGDWSVVQSAMQPHHPLEGRGGRGSRGGRQTAAPAVSDVRGGHSAAGPSSPSPWLRLATWNVLAESNLLANPYLYRRCHPAALPNRLPRVLQGILQLNADVVALQEVESFETFRHSLAQAGYDGLFKKRTGETQVDGVALVWRSARLTMLRYEAVEYAQLLTAGYTGPYAEQMRKHNVGLVGVFQDKLCGREVVVATTYACTCAPAPARIRMCMCG